MSQAKALRFARSALNRLSSGASVKADGLVGGAAAQVAAQGAITDQLYSVGPQQIGQSVDPIDGSLTTGKVLINAPVEESGQLDTIKIFAPSTGTFRLIKYTRTGTTFTKGTTYTANVSTTGLVSLDALSFGLTSIPVSKGEYFLIDAPASWTNTLTSADVQWANIDTAVNLPSVDVTTWSKTRRLEVQINLKVGTAVVQQIGRLSDPITGDANNTSLLLNVPISTTGYLKFLRLYALATGSLTVHRYARSGTSFTKVASYTATISHTGNVTLGPADFGGTPPPVQAGEYLAIDAPNLWTNVQTSGGVSYAALDTTLPSVTVTSFSSSRRPEFQIAIAARSVGPTGEAFAKVQQLAASAASGPLAGKKMGVIGDSISSVFNNLWQDAFLARTKAVLWRQDARPGRTYASALEGYGASAPLADIASLTGYQSTTLLTGAISQSGALGNYNNKGQVPANGTTLAQWLADLDLLILVLGSNDQTLPIGAEGDSYTAGTLYGNTAFVLDAIQAAKPTLPIMGVTNAFNTRQSAAVVKATADAIVAIYKARGLPVLNAVESFGIGPKNYAACLRDNIHPTDDFLQRFYGPKIAQFAEKLL